MKNMKLLMWKIDHSPPFAVPPGEENTPEEKAAWLDTHLGIARIHKEIVLEAVNHSGSNLQCASEACRDDKELVLAAIKQDGRSLRYASQHFKDDKEIVLEAVRQHGCSLQLASRGSS